MNKKPLIKEEGKFKARIEYDKYSTELFTTNNGWQWVGITITPILAKVMIEVLQEYLENNNGSNKP